MQAILSPNAKLLYDFLGHQARRGERTLTNHGYADELGICSTSISDLMRKLGRRGLIEIETRGQSRRILVVAVGKWTAASERLDQGKEKPRTAMRPCLCCKTPFPSEGPHNRLCTPCKHRDGPPVEAIRIPAGVVPTLSFREQIHRCAMTSKAVAIAKRARASA